MEELILNLDKKIIDEICYYKYLRTISNTKIGRLVNLTCKQVSDVLKETKEFKAWIKRDGKWIPVYYKVDGRKIVNLFVGNKDIDG